MIGLALVSFVTVFAAGLKGSIDDAIDKTITGRADRLQQRRLLRHPAATPRCGRGVDGVAVGLAAALTQDIVGAAARAFLTWHRPARRQPGARARLGGRLARAALPAGPDDAVIDRSGPTTTASGSATVRRKTASGKTLTYTVTGTFTDNTDFIGDYAPRTSTPPPSARARRHQRLRRARAGRRRGAVQAAIEDAARREFPTVKAEDRRGSRTRSPTSSTPCSASSTRCCAVGDRLAVRDRQHAGALDPRAHPRARAAAGARHVAPPGAADRPLRGRDHGADRRRPRRGARGAVRGHRSRPLADEGFILTIPVGTLLLLLVLAAIAACSRRSARRAGPRARTCWRRWRTSEPPARERRHDGSSRRSTSEDVRRPSRDTAAD